MVSQRLVGIVVALAVAAAVGVYAHAPSQEAVRKRAEAAMKNGNWKDAYEDFRRLVLDRDTDPLQVGSDLAKAVQCLVHLGREDEADELLEGTVQAHSGNWRALAAAAQQYRQLPHFGYVVAGKFSRGHRRGEGKHVGSFERDRVRALQLMAQARPLAEQDPDRKEAAAFLFQFAEAVHSGASGPDSWRLQYLTDLTALPDYDEAPRFVWRRPRFSEDKGAPVGPDGQPILYSVPAAWEAAENDGQRWRWLLQRAAQLDPGQKLQAELVFAHFLLEEFGVQTLAGFSWPVEDETRRDESGPFALHTLSDDETIARLANGVKRLRLPDEFNYLKLYRKIAEAGRSPQGEAARDALGRIYADRRQYVQAAEAVRTAIREYGPGPQGQRQKFLDQIVGNWGRFEPISSLPAGAKAVVPFRFRNATRVDFEAWEIDVPGFLEDVLAYLRSSPSRLEWNKINVENIGFRLMEERQSKYVTRRVAAWSLDLKPRPGHLDSLIQVTTPLDKPGAYLLTGTVNKGNTTRILVWIQDTILVSKMLDKKRLYLVLDAVTGQPLSGMQVEFFGWRQEQIGRTNAFRVLTRQVRAASDADGQVFLTADQVGPDSPWQWLTIARGQGGRLAFLGFRHVWFGQVAEERYEATKVYVITDRPVYRPLQTVRFKIWVARARYDQNDESPFAHRSFRIKLHDPQGKEVLDRMLVADAYGGMAGEYDLPKDAPLGVYSLQVVDHGGGSFRVEEYKKPEFEVSVEGPKEPLRLGEKFEATIRARYYFGSPVSNAQVKYKVLRSEHSDRWYPPAPWDWLYGRGYGWLTPNHDWYPGFASWGCRCPPPWWWDLSLIHI